MYIYIHKKINLFFYSTNFRVYILHSFRPFTNQVSSRVNPSVPFSSYINGTWHMFSPPAFPVLPSSLTFQRTVNSLSVYLFRALHLTSPPYTFTCRCSSIFSASFPSLSRIQYRPWYPAFDLVSSSKEWTNSFSIHLGPFVLSKSALSSTKKVPSITFK